MVRQSSNHLHAAYATGQIDPETAIDQAIEYLDAETDPAREKALWTLVAATADRTDHIIDVADAMDESLRPGRTVTPDELAALRDLARRRPRALVPLVDTFGTALSNPDESEVDGALVSRLLGDVGVEAPGVAKPALGPLIDLANSGTTEVATEAAWAVVRTAAAEPAMLRPVIAGRVWDLDSQDTTRVRRSLETLGMVGCLLPDRIAGLDRIAALVDHPVSDVRAAAIKALGWVAGRKMEHSLGMPGLDRVDGYKKRIIDRVTDSDANVRLAAIATIGQFAHENPRFVIDCFDDVLLATTDDVWYVRAGALETLEIVAERPAFDPTAVDLEQVQRYVLPRLADDNVDVQTAAASLLVTLIERLGSDRPDIVRHIADILVWAAYFSASVFDGTEPLSVLEDAEVVIPRVSRYMRVVRTLKDADDEAVRLTTAKLCGFVARQSPPKRLPAIGVLQSMLGDEEDSIRRQVLEEFERLVDTDPAISYTIGHIASVVFKHDPELRDKAGSVLAACHAHEPVFLDEAIHLYCRLLRDLQSDYEDDDDTDEETADLGELFGGESGSPRLEPFIETAPCLVADAAPRLVECLRSDDDIEFVAKALARAVANGGAIDEETVRTSEEVVHETEASSSLVAWLSTVQILGTESDAVRNRAVDRLHSLAERDEETPLLSCLTVIEEQDPALVARLLVGHPPQASLPAGDGFTTSRIESVASVVSSHPRLYLRCRGRESPYSDRPLSHGYANDRAWLAELSAAIPQTIPAAEWLSDGFWANDGEATAQLLASVGRKDALQVDTLDSWTAHPQTAVRVVAQDLCAEAGDSAEQSMTADTHLASGATPPNVADCPPTEATAETVDDIAKVVAATDADRCRRALEWLVAVAAQDSDLCGYIRQHLLACSVTVDEVAAPECLLGALVTLAPREQATGAAALTATTDRLPDGPIDADACATIYQQYASFGTAPVRDVAVTALSRLPVETGDPSVVETLMERLGDPDETVRAQAARTVTHYARDPTTISSALVDSLVAELEGPRHVRIACCEALGQCGAADPSVVDRVVSALEIRLRARERGVRRAAATALARVGQARPESLVPVVDLMSKRFQSDAVVRTELLPALAAVPVSAFSNPERVVEPALSELVETTDPSVSQAAGRALAAIADESPGLFHAQLVDVSEQLEEAFSDSFMPDLRDVETSPLSTYWLLQVVATCAEGNRLLAKQFAWLVSETIETLSDGETDGFDSYDLVLDGHVTARGLARVTARVAAFGGLESYETVLKQWGADASKPAPDPTETAHHLVVSDSDIRTKTLEAVSDHAPETRLTGLLEALFEMDINLNRYRAVFESLGDLLPQTDDKRLHRRGVALLLNASRGRNWKIRQAAIQTLAGLGRTDVVPADEVIAHLVGISDIGSRADSTDADAVAELLQHAHIDVETLFTSVLVDYDRSEQSPKRRQTAIRLVGVLGKRHPAVRDQAVGRLVDAVSDDDRWVREEAADGLAEIDAVAPEALRPYRGRLNELKETATDEVANTLEQCFSARTHVD